MQNGSDSKVPHKLFKLSTKNVMSHSLETEWKKQNIQRTPFSMECDCNVFLLVLFTFFQVPLHFIGDDPNIYVCFVFEQAVFTVGTNELHVVWS